MLPNLVEQQTVLSQVMPGALSRGRANTISIVKTLENPLRDSSFYYIVRNDLQSDAYSSAMASLSVMSDSESRSFALKEIARGAALSDIDLALNRITALESNIERAAAKIALKDSLANTENGAGLLKLLPIVQDRNERIAILRLISLFEVKKGNLDGFDESVQALSDSELEAVNSVKTIHNGSLPLAAKLEQAQNIRDRRLRNDTMTGILDLEVTKGFEKSADLVMALPDTYGSHMVSLFAVRWSVANRNAAFGWIKNLPDGQDRDAAVSAVAMSLGHSDPVTARGVAAWTSNSSLRSQIESNIHKQNAGERKMDGLLRYHLAVC